MKIIVKVSASNWNYHEMQFSQELFSPYSSNKFLSPINNSKDRAQCIENKDKITTLLCQASYKYPPKK